MEYIIQKVLSEAGKVEFKRNSFGTSVRIIDVSNHVFEEVDSYSLLRDPADYSLTMNELLFKAYTAMNKANMKI